MRHATRDHTRHRHTRRLAGFIALGLMLAAGCTEDDSRIEKCGATDLIRHGEYVLVNDNEEHPGYAQCIFDDPEEGTMGWTWEANSSGSGNDETAADLFYGCRTFDEPHQLDYWECTTPDLSVQIEDITSLLIHYDLSFLATGKYSLFFSINTLYPSSFYATRVSIDIVIDSTHPPLGANFQAHVKIDGDEYDYYRSASRVPGMLSSSTYHYFIKTIPSHSGTLRLHMFLDFLQDGEYEKLLKRIDFIKLSQKMWGGGAGSTIINSYLIEVKPSTGQSNFE